MDVLNANYNFKNVRILEKLLTTNKSVRSESFLFNFFMKRE
jgi:hypothetical protein